MRGLRPERRRANLVQIVESVMFSAYALCRRAYRPSRALKPLSPAVTDAPRETASQRAAGTSWSVPGNATGADVTHLAKSCRVQPPFWWARKRSSNPVMNRPSGVAESGTGSGPVTGTPAISGLPQRDRRTNSRRTGRPCGKRECRVLLQAARLRARRTGTSLARSGELMRLTLDFPLPVETVANLPLPAETFAIPPLPAGEGWGEGESRVWSRPSKPSFPANSGVTQRSPLAGEDSVGRCPARWPQRAGPPHHRRSAQQESMRRVPPSALSSGAN